MELGISSIEKTCDWSPSQWEISLESGHMIYARYRHGFLSIRKSKNSTSNINDAVGGEELFYKDILDEHDDILCLSTEKFMVYLSKVINNK